MMNIVYSLVGFCIFSNCLCWYLPNTLDILYTGDTYRQPTGMHLNPPYVYLLSLLTGQLRVEQTTSCMNTSCTNNKLHVAYYIPCKGNPPLLVANDTILHNYSGIVFSSTGKIIMCV